MKVNVPAGKYVVAVSGGVDSVVLLSLLAKQPSLKLIVAHFDHGIRPDSENDRKFVAELAKKYKVSFVYDEGKLGPDASEALAREARYKFLEKARKASGASAIVTAHHQDDLLETAVINLIRGTGRRGLTSLKTTEIIKRPLLNCPKSEIKNYALANNLAWRDDPTNLQTNYLRNYVRHKILPRFSKSERRKLLEIIETARQINSELDYVLAELLWMQPDRIDRQWFANFSHDISKEILAAWLRQNKLMEFDRRILERVTVVMKTASPGNQIDVKNGFIIRVGKHNLALMGHER